MARKAAKQVELFSNPGQLPDNENDGERAWKRAQKMKADSRAKRELAKQRRIECINGQSVVHSRQLDSRRAYALREALRFRGKCLIGTKPLYHWTSPAFGAAVREHGATVVALALGVSYVTVLQNAKRFGHISNYKRIPTVYY